VEPFRTGLAAADKAGIRVSVWKLTARHSLPHRQTNQERQPARFPASAVYEIVFTLCFLVGGVSGDLQCYVASVEYEAKISKEHCELVASELEVKFEDGRPTWVLNPRCLRSTDA